MWLKSFLIPQMKWIFWWVERIRETYHFIFEYKYTKKWQKLCSSDNFKVYTIKVNVRNEFANQYVIKKQVM